MCGISGIINLKGAAVSGKTLEAMTQLVAHRGPDGGLIYLDGNIGLGHRLLSITNMDRPTPQPFQDPTGRFIIVFNGQVYNYRELKKSLEKMGHHFQTFSDTEVVLRSYMEFGESCQDHFNGMWSFAIVDKQHQKLFLSRDRFGHKPLYYTQDGQNFYFFSELKQLKAVPSYTYRLNQQAANHFLVRGQQNHEEQTMLENVFALQPGTSLTLNISTGAVQKNIWYLPGMDGHNAMDFEEAKEHFSGLLYDSLRMRMPEQVKTGAFLSGGLDSSSLISLVHRNGLKKKLGPVISCIIPYEGYNEENYIDAFAKAYDIEPVRIRPGLDQSVSNYLDSCLYHQDQPITGISHLAEWLLFSKAKDLGLRVMLDGQGADEILGGYQNFYYKKFLQSFHVLHSIGQLLTKMETQKTSLVSELRNLVKHHPLLSRFFQRSTGQIQSWLRDQTESVATPGQDESTGYPDRLISRLSIQLIKTELPYLLHSMDRNSMAFGIETRLPYLDHRLVDFLLALPDAYKLEKLNSKKILRDSMSDYLPETIINRKKMGFTTPDEILVKNIPYAWWKFDELFERFPAMFHDRVKTDVRAYLDGKRSYNFGLFRLLTFSRWASLFDVQHAGNNSLPHPEPAMEMTA
jgi:asparagine synthase (glutamine-hydrolysing)